MSESATGTITDAVRRAVSAVTDPEYPDISITELGMVESIEVGEDTGTVSVGLVPTVLGCPALEIIAADVETACRSVVDDDYTVSVRFLTEPVWTPNRISPSARRFLARELTIGIRSANGVVICPVCGSRDVNERSAFGPTLCRSVAWCDACRNPVEVIKGSTRELEPHES